MRSEINSITSIRKAKKVYEALHAVYASIVDEKHLEHADWMFRNSTFYKENGIAWWRDRCVSVADGIINKHAKVNRAIEPSPETLAWGGFLGGERVIYMDKAKEADITARVVSIINEAKAA